MPSPPILMVDLESQRKRLGENLDLALQRVLRDGQYILGPEVGALEKQLAAYTGAKHCITCANGTDALVLILMAESIGPGDAVIVPAFTFVATAEAVCLTGATPIFCDVDPDTFNLSPESMVAAVHLAETLNLKPRAAIPVDLFGQPADYPRIAAVAEECGIIIISDAAQSFGAQFHNRRVGQFGQATATSFFPAKPLGCYGDGGAILTNDDTLAELLYSLRFHGKSGQKYNNVRIGMNSRLDTLQAAVLLQKLTIFDDEIAARRRVAGRYATGLQGFSTPKLAEGAMSAWAQYTVLHENRDMLSAHLKDAGVPTAIYYPLTLSKQLGYCDYPCVPGGVPVSEWLSDRVLSLPMHPYLSDDAIDHIVATTIMFKP